MMARWNEKSKVDDGKRRAVGAGVASAESGEGLCRHVLIRRGKVGVLIIRHAEHGQAAASGRWVFSSLLVDCNHTHVG